MSSTKASASAPESGLSTRTHEPRRRVSSETLMCEVLIWATPIPLCFVDQVHQIHLFPVPTSRRRTGPLEVVGGGHLQTLADRTTGTFWAMRARTTGHVSSRTFGKRCALQYASHASRQARRLASRPHQVAVRTSGLLSGGHRRRQSVSRQAEHSTISERLGVTRRYETSRVCICVAPGPISAKWTDVRSYAALTVA